MSPSFLNPCICIGAIQRLNYEQVNPFFSSIL
nr:MAG TPA: hypothetical protein [Bacteriophage sp.]